MRRRCLLVAVLLFAGLGPWAAVRAGEPSADSAPTSQFTPAPPLVLGTGTPGTADGEPTLGDEQAAAVAQMTDIRDIRPPVVYGWDPRWAVGTAVAVLLAVAVALLWWLRRRGFRNQRPGPQAPVVSPEAVAREQLAALDREAGLTDKEFYFRLCATVRTYLDARHRVETLEMTTEELSPVLRRLPLGEELRAELLALFHAADPIRYADAAAGVVRRRQHLAVAKAAVKTTVAAGTEGG